MSQVEDREGGLEALIEPWRAQELPSSSDDMSGQLLPQDNLVSGSGSRSDGMSGQLSHAAAGVVSPQAGAADLGSGSSSRSFSKMPSSAARSLLLLGTKVSGDSNVPAGQVRRFPGLTFPGFVNASKAASHPPKFTCCTL